MAWVGMFAGGTSYRYVAPVEVVPYPSGAGTVYVDNPTKPSASGLVPKYQSQGAVKRWDEQYGTSAPSNKGDVTIRCTAKTNWFFVGWTENSAWSGTNTSFKSTEQAVTWTKVLTYYKTDVKTDNYATDAPKMVTWGNNNKDNCQFYYANFARVKASTASNEGSVSCTPVVNTDGNTVTLTATVNTGSEAQFAYWTRNGEQVSTENPYSFTVASSNYGEYVAVFTTISYPPDGAYVFKNNGTGKYASFASDVLSPNAKREKIYARKFTIVVGNDGKLTTLTGDGVDAYGSRTAFIVFANSVLSSLGGSSPDATTFVNSATTIRLEPVAGGYKAYHQIPALTCGKTWNEIKASALAALSSSSLTDEQKEYVEKVLAVIVPGNKYYLVASSDGSAINLQTDGSSNYAIWNYETRENDYLSSTNGWCRLRNVATGRYAAFVGDSYSASDMKNFQGIAGMKSVEDAMSSPATVFWVRNSSTVSDLYAQGEGLRNITGEWMVITANDDGSVVISPAVATNYHLTDANNSYPTATTGTGNNTHWILEPLTEVASDLYYFGAKCGAKYTDGEHYYTTMLTCFPYQCIDGVNAYYVKGVSNGKVVCQLINSGKVPSNTPVILECNSTDPQKNRLLPLTCSYNYTTNVLTCSDNSVTAITGNKLYGIYFNLDGYTQTSYDADKYLTFSISDGKLGFYKWTGNYLSANKAYLNLQQLPASAKELTGMMFCFDENEDMGIATDISEAIPVQEKKGRYMETDKWYSLDGRLIGSGLHYQPSSKGIYIVNGRKVVIR